jgi:hypothetical protein
MPERAYAGIFQDPEGRVRMSCSQYEINLPFLLLMAQVEMEAEGK